LVVTINGLAAVIDGTQGTVLEFQGDNGSVNIPGITDPGIYEHIPYRIDLFDFPNRN